MAPDAPDRDGGDVLRPGPPRATRRAGARVLVGLLAAIVALPASARDPVEKALQGLRKDLTHRSFPVRARAWQEIASLKDPRALDALVEAYGRKGEEPQGKARIVSVACDAFDRAGDVPALRAWRDRFRAPEDAWLWYRTLRAEVGAVGPEGPLALARAEGPAWPRATAILALAAWGEGGALDLLRDGAVPLSAGAEDRALVVEALAEVLPALEGRQGEPAFRAAATWLANRLDDPTTRPGTTFAIVRALARVYHPPVPYLESAFWRGLASPTPPPAGEHRYAPPPSARFLSLTGIGDRVVYAIDASGSMGDPLTEEELEDLRGKGGGDASDPASALPWKEIRTRIDVAAQFASLSIRHLSPKARFAVVLFGTEVQVLPSTPGLVPATPKAVEAATKDLERARRSGLLGETNLHGALRAALSLRDAPEEDARGRRGDEEQPPSGPGPTTVFVLSDGYPSADDWSGTGPTRKGDVATYAEEDALLDDVERMNLFARCEIHAVEIGSPLMGAARSLMGAEGPLGPLYDRLLRGTLERSLPARLARLGHGGRRLVPGWKPSAVSPPRPLSRDLEDRLARDALRDLVEGKDALQAMDVDRVVEAKFLDAVPYLIPLLEHEDADLRERVVDGLPEMLGHEMDGGLERPCDLRRLRRNWEAWWAANEDRLRQGR